MEQSHLEQSHLEYLLSSSSPSQTQRWGERIAALLQGGDVIALEGDLGAGKTTFTQGLAHGLGVEGVVNSPTFTIIKEYEGRIPLFHMDVYRVHHEFEDLGFDEYFYGSGVTVVEWASLIRSALPLHFLDIYIKRLEGDFREILLKPQGDHYIRICEELSS